MTAAAVFDSTGTYRYTLTRRWGTGERSVLWIMLNPSTADATTDDATIRKCRLFSRRWGYDELTVVNCFALRATDPRELVRARLSQQDVVGPENDDHLRTQLGKHDFVVAGWGQWVAQGWLAYRDDQVRTLIRQSQRAVYHLGLTLRQQPKHPLYLAGDTVPLRWEFTL